MNQKDPLDQRTNTEFSATQGAPLEAPFGSNAIRLTMLQWASAIAIVLVILVAVPSWWSGVDPSDARLDFRLPYSLNEDYWMYQQHVHHAVSQQKIVVVGDSVVWGEYVEAGQTLSHYLSEQMGTQQFANGGLNGAHPLALSGLVQNYASGLRDCRIVVQCNLLWMSSPERDLQVEKQIPFNHSDLVPQFVPRIPCYKATMTVRLGTIVDRNLAFRSWAKHLRIAAFDGQDLPRWTLEHPWSNPLTRIYEHPAEEEQPRPASVPWVERGIQKQDLPWVDLDTSLQWQAFQALIHGLIRRNDAVFVIVSPLNEHLLTAASLQRYHHLVDQVGGWLREQAIAHASPPVLPSREYADASHPLAAGYSRLAQTLVADPQFQQWLFGK